LPSSENRAGQLMDLWQVSDEPPGRKARLLQLIEAARDRLPALIGPPRSRTS